MSGPPLRYRAGGAALERLRRHGLTPAAVGALAGPASGPRWLVLTGIDRAVVELGLHRGTPERPTLLVGASAGAWRAMALASDDPPATLDRLREAYTGRVFPRRVTMDEVSASYRELVREVFGPAVASIVGARDRDAAAHAARVRRGWPSRGRAGLAATLGLYAALDALHPRAAGLVVERVLFHTRPERYRARFRGRVVRLDATNAEDVALASGSVPLAMAPVTGIAGAPPGAYLDGGLTDYHLRQRHRPPDGAVLLPHFRRRILPGWFDRRRRRRPAPDVLDELIQIHPSRAFLDALPGGRPPDRRDFYELADRPDERLRRWREATARGEALGEALLRDVESGALVERTERF